MITNREFGAKIGVGHSMASRIRNGERLPSVHVLGRIHQEFDIPTDVLIRAHRRGPEQFGKLIRERLDALAAA